MKVSQPTLVLLAQMMTWGVSPVSSMKNVQTMPLAPTALLHPVFEGDYDHPTEVASVYAGLSTSHVGHGRSLQQHHVDDHRRLVEDFQRNRKYSRFEQHRQRFLKTHQTSLKKAVTEPNDYYDEMDPMDGEMPIDSMDGGMPMDPMNGEKPSFGKNSGMNPMKGEKPSFGKNSGMDPKGIKKTQSPIMKTTAPTNDPTFHPTYTQTNDPTPKPTAKPTAKPTFKPTNEPTNQPTRYTLEAWKNTEVEVLPIGAEDSPTVPSKAKTAQNQKVGGRFNAYQAVPVSQGIGTHYVSVFVGTPEPQRSTVIVDTGSHFTAFPCKPCEGCGEEYHTDKYYDPEKSQTFRQIGCGSDCTGSCQRNKCIFSQSYSEGSSWTADLVQDNFFCSSRTTPLPQDKEFAIPFVSENNFT